MGLVVGVPKEHDPHEYRVGMTPAGVSLLTGWGSTCYVEHEAGLGSGFADSEYEQAGARITYSHDEVFRRAELLLKVQRPTLEEAGWMADGQMIMSLLMLFGGSNGLVQILQERRATAIAYELIQEPDGRLPVLHPLSQIGGRMVAQIAAYYSQNNHGGKGILLGGIASVPPADVVIIGAGVVGTYAADALLRMGARVILLDHDLEVLQTAHERFAGQVTTMVSHDFNVARVCKFADVLVGAVQIPGVRTPVIITRELLRTMRPGSLVIDMSIDQGGCVETSRPTSHDNPTFEAEGIIHYCVPNLPGVVGRTATHAYLNAAWPYISRIARDGLDDALEHSPDLRRGLVLRQGERQPR
jgi:alanine dehydrogenase